MTIYEKPKWEIPEVEVVLSKYFGSDVSRVTQLSGGNLCTVFSFSFKEKEYVIKFSDLSGELGIANMVIFLLILQP